MHLEETLLYDLNKQHQFMKLGNPVLNVLVENIVILEHCVPKTLQNIAILDHTVYLENRFKLGLHHSMIWYVAFQSLNLFNMYILVLIKEWIVLIFAKISNTVLVSNNLYLLVGQLPCTTKVQNSYARYKMIKPARLVQNCIETSAFI